MGMSTEHILGRTRQIMAIFKAAQSFEEEATKWLWWAGGASSGEDSLQVRAV